MNIDHYDILSADDGAANIASVTPSTITWRARDRELQTPVFLRMLRPACRDNAEARDLFMKQSRTLALLRHAGGPAVYRLGEHEGTCFCAHEPIEGTSLHEVIAQGTLAPSEALDIACQIARVLEAADE